MTEKLYRKCPKCKGRVVIDPTKFMTAGICASSCGECTLVTVVPADQPEAPDVIAQVEACRHTGVPPEHIKSVVDELIRRRRAAEGVWVEPGMLVHDAKYDTRLTEAVISNEASAHPKKTRVYESNSVIDVPTADLTTLDGRPVLGVRKPLTYRQVIEQALRRWTATKAQDKYILEWADEQDRKRQGGQ